MISDNPARRRGGPLAMLAVLALAWIGGRTMLWESPFQLPDFGVAMTHVSHERPAAKLAMFGPATPSVPLAQADAMSARLPAYLARPGLTYRTAPPAQRSRAPRGQGATLAAGHSLLIFAALRMDQPRQSFEAFGQASAPSLPAILGAGYVNPAAPPLPPMSAQVDRWSLDAWSFLRQGSSSAAISQGRVPIYGASQLGAVLQYRLRPGSSRDPRVFVRGYDALVPDGESEIAAGLSARPVGSVPVRAFAEVRVTQNPFGTDLRPAAYAMTEIPPVALPLGSVAEVYAGAGYVGGNAPTAFVDGQVTATRPLARFGPEAGNRAQVSLGAGAWGGAQVDASRIDVGPTVRLDVTLGDVPARLSFDWRERIAGDASPQSGLAATLSTRF